MADTTSRTLDVRRMRVLREVAERGTIAAAARALAFTPSAVSQQLAALERETGVALLDRHGGRVHLTEAGRRLVGRTEAILAELEAATAELSAAAAEVTGDVHVAAFPSAERALLAPAIATLAGAPPGRARAHDRARARGRAAGAAARRRRPGDLARGRRPAAPAATRRLERADLLDDPLWLALPRGSRRTARGRARRARRRALGRDAARHRLPGDGRRRLPGRRLRPRHPVPRERLHRARRVRRRGPASRWSPGSRSPRSARRSRSARSRTSRLPGGSSPPRAAAGWSGPRSPRWSRRFAPPFRRPAPAGALRAAVPGVPAPVNGGH